MSDQNLNWKIAAAAGEGVMLASKLFAKTCKRHGMKVFNYYEYPSLIKGGHQTGQVYADFTAANCQQRRLDVLVLFHEKSLPLHLAELDENSILVINAKSIDISKYPELKSKVICLPFNQIARQAAGNKMVANMVALGISSCLLGLDLKILAQVVQAEFADNKEMIVKNLAAINQACKEVQTLMRANGIAPLKNILPQADEQILLTGNEAVGLGAIAAGLQYYSAYPMTPASGLLHYLAAKQESYPLVVKHSEDEIGAINQALGASFAGVRSMTGSSGGGFALMVEALSMAGVAELPLVILEAMRQGPATGLPTWTSQADLNFIINAGHGDFTKVVLTPASVQEHYDLSRQAFYLAEKYQLPVFVLSDKYLLESHQTMTKPENTSNERYSMLTENPAAPEQYLRYLDSDSGISPRAIPGLSEAIQLCNSYDHDQAGFATEDQVLTKQAVDKRLKKLSTLVEELPQPQIFGAKVESAKQILISFGSTTNVLLELYRQLSASKSPLLEKISFIHLPCVAPFPKKALAFLAQSSAAVFTVEGTATGQLAQLIKQNIGRQELTALLRYDGRPFYTQDLMSWLAGQELNEQYRLEKI